MDEEAKLFRRSIGPDGHTDKVMLYLRGALTDARMFGPENEVEPADHGRLLLRAKGFWASGRIADHGYGVGVFWGGELADAVEVRGDVEDAVRSALEAHRGEWFEFAHPGHGYELQLDHPMSILTALMNLSTDFEWHGDKPPGFPRFRDDVDY